MRGRQHLLTYCMLFFWVLALVVGCGQKSVETPATAEGVNGLGPAEPLDSAPPEVSYSVEGRTSGPMVPVYFSFDSALIEGDQVSRIEKNGEFIRNNPDVRVRLEGNCDPRGTREYNLALGERRAQSTKKYLVNLGVEPERLSTVSWGEEKLLLYGHDELSWAQNRRVDFVLVK